MPNMILTLLLFSKSYGLINDRILLPSTQSSVTPISGLNSIIKHTKSRHMQIN